MLTNLHSKNGVQLGFGLVMGVIFGFLLQKGGVTNYDVILGQLLLTDFTVVKIMLSAVVTGTVGGPPWSDRRGSCDRFVPGDEEGDRT